MKKLKFNDLLSYVGKIDTPTLYSVNNKSGILKVIKSPKIRKPTNHYDISIGIDSPYLLFCVFPEDMNKTSVQQLMFPILGREGKCYTNNILFLNKQDAVKFAVSIIKEKMNKEQEKINKLLTL